MKIIIKICLPGGINKEQQSFTLLPTNFNGVLSQIFSCLRGGVK